VSEAEALERTIVAFHQDAAGEWIAELSCTHRQHVRHDPPWQVRTWVTSESGRRGMLGLTMPCEQCQEELPARG